MRRVDYVAAFRKGTRVKVLVFVDHDIICRHFLMNGALDPLIRAADVRFVFPEDGGRRVKLDPASLVREVQFETVPIDSKRQQTWRWVLFADQLKFRQGAHETTIRRIRRKILGWKAALLLTLAGLPLGAIVFRAIVKRRLDATPNIALSALLDRERPDVVLHPSVLDSVFINDLVIECSARKIPFVVVMNSWDNPSTKRAVVGNPDWLLVWGPQTHDHAVRFTGIEGDRVVSFGAAQFDVFRDRPRVDRAQFCAAHGIDSSRRIVLFAGSNALTDEFGVVQTLDQAVDDGRLPNVTIVYRPHPWGNAGQGGVRFANGVFKNVVIDRTMLPYIDRVAAGIKGIYLPDYRDTHDLLSAVDVVASPMSTILLEAALHAKPVVAYTSIETAQTDQLAFKLPLLHFAEFLKLPEIASAGTVDELISELATLVDPVKGRNMGERFQFAASYFVTPYERPWKERLVSFLQGLACENSAGGVKVDWVKKSLFFHGASASAK